MKKISLWSTPKSIVYLVLACGFLPTHLNAGWVQTAPGSYDFNDTGNWTGGVIDGVFGSALTGTQTVTFGADTNLPSATNTLNFSYTAAQDMTLQSADATNRVLTMNGNITSSSGTSLRTIAIGTALNPLALDLGASNRRFTAGDNTNLSIGAKITGGSGGNLLLINTTTGGTSRSVTLSNDSNDFTSNMQIEVARNMKYTSVANGGVASALGAGTFIRLANGSSFTNFEYVGALDSSTDRTIQMNATTGQMGFLNTGAGKLTFTGDFTRTDANNITLNFQGTQQITVTGNIADSTGVGQLTLRKTGTNLLVLTGTNQYTGSTQAQVGRIEFDSLGDSGVAGALGAGNRIELGTGGNTSEIRYIGSADISTNRTVDLSGTTGGGSIQNFGAGVMELTGDFEVSGNGAKTLFLDGTNTGNNEIQSNIGDSGAGAVSVAKNSSGKWNLSGSNTYSGSTTVNGGTLLINGSLAAGSAVSVSDGATLGGSGVINGSVSMANNATLAAGESPGVLTLAGGLSLNAAGGTVLEFELGTISDRIDITGGTFSSNASGFTSINILNAGGLVVGTYTLIDWTGAASSGIDLSDFQLDLDVPGAIGELGIVGSELQLVVSAVPEPGAILLLLAAGTGFILRRNWRTRDPSRG